MPPTREQLDAARQEVAALDAERTALVEERRRLQRVLGEQAGKSVMSLAKVEKTNGTPSFVAGVRLLQRVHRRAANPAHGIDGAGAIFADPARTEEFVRSHGVPATVAPAAGPGTGALVVIHAFHGVVGLVELRQGDRVRHLDPAGEDPGDIRPAATYDPEFPAPASLSTLCSWSVTLSSHISRPYVQLIWVEAHDGPVLVAVDVDPERIPVLQPEWDLRLGSLFDSAHARMLLQPYRAGALANRVPGGTFRPEETR
ncbi:hypothetical protein LEP48_05110 [Isoptericola sp. NEAU-Y5]|uniref:Uncharacterized protein n=1 Tax=Isoptericola luteus TaxID=2879484 RepID=A0ABS7ZE38_9MICO|nr:hypothetical protein [Isoptericola sp. NEAU-Y5]MCA5892732.1 hypothetical protein [Isoptericola sp. NEAU-Y5]